jgi:hypothetical protein
MNDVFSTLMLIHGFHQSPTGIYGGLDESLNRLFIFRPHRHADLIKLFYRAPIGGTLLTKVVYPFTQFINGLVEIPRRIPLFFSLILREFIALRRRSYQLASEDPYLFFRLYRLVWSPQAPVSF